MVNGYIFKKVSHKPNLNYFIKDFENWWKITTWGKIDEFGISNESIIYLFIFGKFLRDRGTNQ